MSVLAGCHAARNMIILEEVPCPKCGASIELFIRDGVRVAEAVCEACGFVLDEHSDKSYIVPAPSAGRMP